ncbi:hypothetical protein CL618_00510 [archaeon]|nr:hypothetical protein [archaeon]|tara:strand:+ start:295 stop:597 length:303 start_codon:yes stop_codon:yes gene_type:complete
MENIFIAKPYFTGQIPSQCGHYHPDVIRIRNEKIGEVYIRVLDCVVCGEIEEQLDPNMLSEELVRELDLNGVSGTDENDLKERRKIELERILSDNDSRLD